MKVVFWLKRFWRRVSVRRARFSLDRYQLHINFGPRRDVTESLEGNRVYVGNWRLYRCQQVVSFASFRTAQMEGPAFEGCRGLTGCLAVGDMLGFRVARRVLTVWYRS